jgi:hypothetical protein
MILGINWYAVVKDFTPLLWFGSSSQSFDNKK